MPALPLVVKKRLEQSCLVIIADPRTVVSDYDLDAGSAAVSAG